MVTYNRYYRTTYKYYYIIILLLSMHTILKSVFCLVQTSWCFFHRIQSKVLIQAVQQEKKPSFDKPELGFTQSPLRVFIVFITVWQFSFGISNAAIAVILAFLPCFLQLITRTTNISTLLLDCPKTLKSAQKMIGFRCPSFERFVVRPACNSIYSFKDCIRIQPDGKEMPATCRHVEYPNHPKAHFRNPCGADLLSLVSRNKSKPSLQANKEYCYQHLTDAIGLLINQPNFLEKCEQWRNRGGDSELLSDIYDG